MDVRLIELPRARAAFSGVSQDADPFSDGSVLSRFDAWFSARTDPLALAPRDLMWFDVAAGGRAWALHLEPDEDAEEWAEIALPGGLHASAICRDGDDGDGERVLAQVRAWLATSPFVEETRSDRPVAFRIITPQAVRDALGYHQLELLVPIAVR